MKKIVKNNISNKESTQNKLIDLNDELCDDTIDKLKDNHLINEYNDCKSIQNKIKKLTHILEKHKIKHKTKELIINDYLLKLIPAETKGVIRENKIKI